MQTAQAVRLTIHRPFALEPQVRRALLAAAALLTLLDGVATYIWLGLGHAEANPLLVALIHAVGAGPAMAIRVAVGLGLLAALGGLSERARLAPYALVVVTGILLGVGLWHGYGVVLTFT